MIGVDIVSIARFERFLERFGRKALEKYLDNNEISYIKTPSNAAGFFAAKEAVLKALGTGISHESGFKDVKIHKDSKNAPYFTLSKHLVEKFQITSTSLSISHDGGFAIAVAVIDSKTKQICVVSHD